MTARKHGRRGAAFLALLFFGGLAALPWLFNGDGPPPWVAAAKATSPVTLPPAPPALPTVKLSSYATPQTPDASPAAAPSDVDALHQAALVAAEDNRLHTLLHNTNHLVAPSVILVAGATPTLVLPARPDAYSLSDLENAGAVVPLQNGGIFMLQDSVLVRPGATLSLGGADGMTLLLMDSGASTFTSLVVWGGTLELSGAGAGVPLTITGWDHVNNEAAEDRGYGRPYIRDVGGKLTLEYIHVSNLGFWSGRTGGVAWTGVSEQPATGSALSSTFTDDAYGAFVSASEKVTFTNDLFESNELDGLRLHKGANDSTIMSSASVRNGANGFVVARGAASDVLTGDVALHNAGNGFLLNGTPLSRGASPSGDAGVSTVGTTVESSEAEQNARTAILVEGGVGTVLRDNIVCGVATAVAVNSGAADTYVVGNEILCGTRVALSIGPAVTGTTVSGDTLDDARIGILVRNSPGVRIMSNRFNDITVFGMSIRGTSPGIVGNDNVITGRGFAPIDVRGGAPAPHLLSSNVDGWQHDTVTSFWSYLRFHPLLSAWLAILVLVAAFCTITRFRRQTQRPYRHAVPWRPAQAASVVPATEESRAAHAGDRSLAGHAHNGHSVTEFALPEAYGGERSPEPA